MSDPSPIDPNRVDWSGDNPGIYLKTAPDGDFSSLCVWFRIAVSPHGPGQVLVLFEDPKRAAHWPALGNICLADNAPLARYLIDNFCTRFGVDSHRLGDRSESIASEEFGQPDQNSRHQTRALVDEPGVQLHQARTGPQLLVGVLGAENSANADDRKTPL